MTETCSNCGTLLEPAREGWIQLVVHRNSDGINIAFFGTFSKFESFSKTAPLSGLFAWVGEQCDIPEGLFCPRGHIGISRKGRITR
jgi:hypothetical protein